MRHLFLIWCLLGSVCQLWAGISLESTIRDVDYRANHQLAGICTIEIGSEVFADAGPASPKYLALRLDSGVLLADTLVLQSSPTYLNTPINLPLLLEGEPDVTVVAARDALRIVRWVAGEDRIWVEARQSSNLWLSRNGLPMPPDSQNRVSIQIGESARGYDQIAIQGSNANMPFASRQTFVTEGQFSVAVSALLCLDFRPSSITSSGLSSLLAVRPSLYDSDANLGGGVYAPATSIPCILFLNGDIIARGLARSCNQTAFEADIPTVHTDVPGFWRLKNRLSADLSCASGSGNGYLTTAWAEGSRIVVKAQGPNAGFPDNPQVWFAQGWEGFPSVRPETAFIYGHLTLYREVELIYFGPDQATDQTNLAFDLELYYPSGASSPSVMVETVLRPQGNPADSEPYTDIDQHRFCEPQPLILPSQTIALGGPAVPVLNPLGLTVLIASLCITALLRRKHQSRPS